MSGYEKSSYSQVPQPGAPSYTEAWGLIEAARRMATALDDTLKDSDDLKSRNVLREAVQLNWKLWTIFQAELTLGNSDAPDDIRDNMLTLCKFVDQHSVDTMREPSPERIATLIDINRNIASGILESIQKTEAEAEAAANAQGEIPAAVPQTAPAPAAPEAETKPDDQGPPLDKINIDV